MVGFPFAHVIVRPTDDLTLQMSYALLTNIHGRVTYRLAPPLRVYVGYDWNNENYFRAARDNIRDRLFFYDQEVKTGVMWNLGHNVTLDLHGGYAFDRYYFEGRNRSDSNVNRVNIGDGPFAAFQVQVRY
jgi:hypothetical protein